MFTLAVAFQTDVSAQYRVIKSNAPAAQKILTEIPEANVKSVIASNRRRGYVPVFIDGFNHSTKVATNSGTLKTFFNIIFEKKNVSMYDVNVAAPFIVYTAGNERIIFLESYKSEDGKIKFAIIYKNDTAVKFKGVHVPANQFQAKFNQLKGQGYHISTRSNVKKGGTVYTTALFEKSNVGTWISKPNKTAAQATQLMLQYRNQGLTLKHMDVPNYNKKYNLIFHKKPASNAWYAKNNLSQAQLLNAIAQAKNNGYKTTIICGFDKPGLWNGNEIMKIRYAVTFVK